MGQAAKPTNLFEGPERSSYEHRSHGWLLCPQRQHSLCQHRLQQHPWGCADATDIWISARIPYESGKRMSEAPGSEPVLYHNKMSVESLAGWVREGPVTVADGLGGAVLSSAADPDEMGAHAHFVLWCPEIFPDRIRISWDYHPIDGQGLAMVFFGAQGSAGRDIFSPELAPRTGFYPQYHSSDISALHVSYQRRKFASERAFRTCNLRKSPGGHLVAQGADPLPSPEDADGFYRVEVCKDGPQVTLSINGLQIFHWLDDDAATGPQIGGGYLGFRQMAPLRAAYKNLTVTRID